MTLIAAAPAGATFPGHNGRFAFIALDRHGRQALFTEFPRGTGLRLVRRGTIDSPAWSRDGRRIVFADGNGLGVVRADGSGYRHLEVPPNVDAADPTWAPDGRRVAFTGFTSDPASPENEITDTAVYVGRLDGSGFTRVRAGSDPAWSPNGRRIAYVSDGKGVSGDSHPHCTGIWTMKPTGAARTRVTGRTAHQCRVFGLAGQAPDYSPDGRRIIYVRPIRKAGNASDRNDEVFIVRAGGRRDTRISHTLRSDEANPTFSPDGRRIAYGSFSTRARESGLFYARADGHGKRRFRDDVLQVAWQPLR
jgi:Tol biopolymer transport system component